MLHPSRYPCTIHSLLALSTKCTHANTQLGATRLEPRSHPVVALLINQSWGRPHFLSEARSAVRPLLCTKNKSVLNLAGLGSLFGRGSAPQQEMACPRNAGFFCGIVASLFAVPIQCKPTASAPWFLYPPVKARALVPQQAPEQAPTRFDVPAYDQERANQNHKATAQLIPLDLEHPVLDPHFASLHAELNVFMWGDSSIVHQFFLLRGLTGGLPSLTPRHFTALRCLHPSLCQAQHCVPQSTCTCTRPRMATRPSA